MTSTAHVDAQVRVALALVAADAEIEPSLLTGPSRVHTVVQARQLAMWLAHRWTGVGAACLAYRFGRDSTTVGHGIRQAERRIQADAEVAETALRLEDTLRRDGDRLARATRCERPVATPDRLTHAVQRMKAHTAVSFYDDDRQRHASPAEQDRRFQAAMMAALEKDAAV
jgi:hypothetical protein